MEMNNCDNVCILLGSPDANGNTAAMCKNAAVFLDNMKIKYQIYNLYEEEIDYVLLEISKYDAVIIATPIHSFYCSDMVKELMDLAFEDEEFFENSLNENGEKIRCGIMVSHGYDEEYATEPFETGFSRWCEHVGFDYYGKLSVRDTGDKERFCGTENLKKTEKFICGICGINERKDNDENAYILGKDFYLTDADNDKKTFERLFNMYMYELSAYVDWMGECMTDDALFIPDRLSEYYEMNEKKPYIVKYKNKTAGLVVFLFPDKKKEPAEADFYIEEIFILRRYRENHIAAEIIKELWKKNKGICAVCALKKNKISVRFWENIIKKSNYEYTVKEDDEVFFFEIKVE